MIDTVLWIAVTLVSEKVTCSTLLNKYLLSKTARSESWHLSKAAHYSVSVLHIKNCG